MKTFKLLSMLCFIGTAVPVCASELTIANLQMPEAQLSEFERKDFCSDNSHTNRCSKNVESRCWRRRTAEIKDMVSKGIITQQEHADLIGQAIFCNHHPDVYLALRALSVGQDPWPYAHKEFNDVCRTKLTQILHAKTCPQEGFLTWQDEKETKARPSGVTPLVMPKPLTLFEKMRERLGC